MTGAHDNRAALANYDKAIELFPDFTDAWVRKGITLFNEGYIPQAEECFSHALQIQPLHFKAVYNRGRLRLHTHDTEGAVADLDKATTLKPEHAGSHQYFAEALEPAGKETEAEIHFRLAEELRTRKKKP